MAEHNKEIVRRIVDEVFSQGKVGLADTLVGPSYVYHGPGGLEVRGPDGFKQLVNVYRSAFPDLTITVDDLIAEGDKVACRWTGRGTHKGDFGGIAPTGRAATVTGILMSRFSGGQLVEDWESWDEVGLLRQLGVATIPAPAHA